MSDRNEVTFEALTRGPALYTPAEVARLLRVSPRTVLNWIREGRLEAIRLSPRVYRVMLAALVKLLFPERIRHVPTHRTGRIPEPGRGETWMKKAKRKASA
ncbi:MAG: helix-turn-helix domain-containing protein [Chloroflexi bacterium]|nr:helix-turn-helix domain-containing protein [Chloroflexota bacterium]